MIDYINLVRSPSHLFHLAVFNGEGLSFLTLCGRPATPNPDPRSISGWQDKFLAFPFRAEMCSICFQRVETEPPSLGVKTQT